MQPEPINTSYLITLAGRLASRVLTRDILHLSPDWLSHAAAKRTPATARILPRMSFTLDPHLYRHAPILLWPWIWLQLICLRRWAQAQDRTVLYSITPHGRVHVHYISDAKTMPYADFSGALDRPSAYRTQAEDPSGEAHLSPIHYWMDRLIQRGELIQFITRRTGHAAAPQRRDSG